MNTARSTVRKIRRSLAPITRRMGGRVAMAWTSLALAAFAMFPVVTWAQAPLTSWPEFQNGGQLVVAVSKAPLEWSPNENVAWSAELIGYGQSTPVVHDGQIYITTVTGDNKENLHVQALDLESGDELWKHELANSTPDTNDNYHSRAAPTPVADDQGVIAFFEGGNLIALDRDGKVRWERDLVADYGPITARHGLAGSLEQNEDRVFVHVERQESPYVLAVSKKDGSTIWRSNGLGGDEPVTSWASPRLVPVADGHHLVVSGSGLIAGYDPNDGSRLWTFTNVNGNSTQSVVPAGDGRFLVGAAGGREAAPGGGNPAHSNGLVQIQNSGDDYSADWVWQAERATSSFGSPMAWQGRAWFVNRAGVVFGLDMESGKEVTQGRTAASSVWATPVGTNDHLYLFGKDGTTAVIGPEEKLNVMAENKGWNIGGGNSAGGPGGGGPVLYAGVVIEGRCLLRRGDRLVMVVCPDQ